MELDDSYYLDLRHVEETVVEAYKDGIKELAKSNNPEVCYEIAIGILKSLGESHPSRDIGFAWASEIIPAYRNMVRILKELSNIKYFDSLSSKYHELLDNYSDDSIIGEEYPQLERALEDLSKLKKILDRNKVDGAGDLEKKFVELDDMREKLGEMEKKVKVYEQNSKRLEEL